MAIMQGAHIVDSCSNPAFALNQSLEFVRDLIGTSDVRDYECHDGSEPQLRSTSPRRQVVAVVGASYSSVTVQIANLLRLFRIPQVSPASTNADLSDKNRFEYFARTVPSDNYQARAMIDIALHFNWTYVSLVYSADEYGELGADTFKKEARRVNICIALEERILPKKDSVTDSVNNLVKKLQPEKSVGARVVVLFVGTEYIALLMDQTAKRMGHLAEKRDTKKIIWLASESWDRHSDAYVQGARKWAAHGSIVLMLASQRVPTFDEYYLSLHPGTDNFERNRWLRELWREKFDCRFGLPEGAVQNRCEEMRLSPDSFSPDDKVQFVIDAVLAIAHGLRAMKDELCPDESAQGSWFSRHLGGKHSTVCPAMRHIDGGKFYNDYLLKAKFDGVVGNKFHFSPEGDGPAHYTILNYQPQSSFSGPEYGGGGGGEEKRKRSETVRSDYVHIGSWSEDKLVLDESKMWWTQQGEPAPISMCSLPCPRGFRKQLIKDELCCWACSKCEDFEFLANETTCVDCGEGLWPTKDRTACFELASSQLRHMRWTSWYSIAPTILATVGISVTLFTITVFVIYKDTPIVKASGRELSGILLVGILLCYLMTFILLSRPSTFICAFKRIGIGFAFSSLYSAMFVKTNRIARIFSLSTKSAQRPGCISPLSQVMLTVLLAGTQLVGSLLWLWLVPPATRHVYPTRDQVVLTCNVPEHHFLYSLTYDAVLIVLCTTYAVKTRKVPENFNETKFIGFAMYTTCVIWVSWIFFFFGTQHDFQLQTSSLCVAISMSANVALVCIFSPKLWIILFEKHKNVRKQEGEYMLTTKRSTNSSTYVRRSFTNRPPSLSGAGCPSTTGPASASAATCPVHHEVVANQYTALLEGGGRSVRRSMGATDSTTAAVNSNNHHQQQQQHNNGSNNHHQQKPRNASHPNSILTAAVSTPITASAPRSPASAAVQQSRKEEMAPAATARQSESSEAPRRNSSSRKGSVFSSISSCGQDTFL